MRAGPCYSEDLTVLLVGVVYSSWRLSPVALGAWEWCVRMARTLRVLFEVLVMPLALVCL